MSDTVAAHMLTVAAEKGLSSEGKRRYTHMWRLR
jgi:hypothetical protein